MERKKCPRGHADMVPRKINRVTNFRGVDVKYETEAHICPECGLEAATVEQAGVTQRAISDAYRKKMKLLTGEEIRLQRKQKGLTQQTLADLINVGVASIKRWETGLIQSKAMDHVLRVHLQGYDAGNTHSGNREFSIPRIKLVIRTFEKHLGKKLLKKTDKLLFAAKYLWYADMLAFRDLGRGITGANYAALPYGPQVNNYSDLIDEIKNADENKAEPLIDDEIRIIERIVKAFPNERMAYDAAHRELVWKRTPIGGAITYLAAAKLTEV